MKTRSRVGRKLNSRYINRIDVYREGDTQVVMYPLPWFLTNNKDKELITGVYLLGVLSHRKTLRAQPRINTPGYEAKGLRKTIDNTR